MSNIERLTSLFKASVQVAGIHNAAQVHDKYQPGFTLSVNKSIELLTKLTKCKDELVISVNKLEEAINAATSEEECGGHYDRSEHPDAPAVQLELPIDQTTGTYSKPRKKRDTTKLTQRMHDFICSEFAAHTYSNRELSQANREKASELCNDLNVILDLDKSNTFYSKIWNGNVDRSMLPKGKAL